MIDVIKDISALIGGAGIIIIGLSKLLGSIFQDRLKENQRKKTEEQLELAKQKYGNKRIQTDRFVNTQYEVYIELWKNLQGMKLSVNALWSDASESNIIGLSGQLEIMQNQISNWSLFFDSEHLNEIKALLKILEDFHSGKMDLIRLRHNYSNRIPRSFSQELEEEIIQKNKDYKERFENILEKIREDFQYKLSNIE
ncbi:MAG: hypothetical protein ACLKAN_12725 [Alkaliphilus sp.]